MANPMVQVNVRIDPSLYAKVKARAKKDGVTVTAVIDSALRKAVGS
jgi:predicted HicB family RNase H-like nuclease